MTSSTSSTSSSSSTTTTQGSDGSDVDNITADAAVTADNTFSNTIHTDYKDVHLKKDRSDVAKNDTQMSHDKDGEREIPIEIDDHFRLFGKEPWEVEYGEKCTECQSRIDEYGFCSCDASGD